MLLAHRSAIVRRSPWINIIRRTQLQRRRGLCTAARTTELPQGWQSAWCSDNKHEYFYAWNTKQPGKAQVQWERPTEPPEAQLIYESPLATPLRILKRVSIGSCGLTMIGMPALLYLGNNDSVPVFGQMALAGIVVSAAVASTSLLHFFSKAFAHRLYQNDGIFTAKVVNLLGVYRFTEFSLDEVKPTPDGFNPFVLFEAQGKPYYVQGLYFEDKQLLRKFVGKPLEGDQTRFEEWE